MKVNISKGLFKSNEAFPEHEGKLYERIHYEDLKDSTYLSKSEIVHLIERVKKDLERGIETRFINVSPELKEELKGLDLEGIITFE